MLYAGIGTVTFPGSLRLDSRFTSAGRPTAPCLGRRVKPSTAIYDDELLIQNGKRTLDPNSPLAAELRYQHRLDYAKTQTSIYAQELDVWVGGFPLRMGRVGVDRDGGCGMARVIITPYYSNTDGL